MFYNEILKLINFFEFLMNTGTSKKKLYLINNHIDYIIVSCVAKKISL